MNPIAQAARGRWRDILPALGVSAEHLTGRHCPCPICGGKDKFRFDDRDGYGTYFCNTHGSGDAFKLLMGIRGIDFKTCAKLVEGVIGKAEYTPPPVAQSAEHQKRAMRKLWGESVAVSQGDAVDKYLASRSLTNRPPALRFVDRCRTSRGEFHPAMLALVSGAAGEPLSIHRTYLGESGKAELANPRELMAGKLSDGCAVRLSPPGSVLGVAEGIETALAASSLFNVPVWAAISAGMLEKWQPPAEAQEIVIFADSDSNFTGQKAAYALAHRLAAKGRTVSVKLPPRLGTDWADVIFNREGLSR